MSYKCIKLDNPDKEFLEKLTEELKDSGLKEETDFVLFELDGGSFFLDFTSEASEKLKKISIMEKYGINENNSESIVEQ